MRLVTFEAGGKVRAGALMGDQVVDLAAADAGLPGDVLALLQGGLLERAARAVAAAPAAAKLALSAVTLRPPIERPGKILCLGLNYADHAAEANQPTPQFMVVFARFASSLVGPTAPLVRPRASDKFDYEAELAIVVGTGGRAIPKAQALAHVAGYSVFNDGSLRDYQTRTSQWTMGKNFDGTGAFGPALVTTDEVPTGAHGLKVQTRLNGRTLQDGNTANMIFDVATTIANLSEVMTLEAGDVIITGTPAGVGMARKPQVWLQPGDVCEVEIEGLGVLRNPVVQG